MFERYQSSGSSDLSEPAMFDRSFYPVSCTVRQCRCKVQGARRLDAGCCEVQTFFLGQLRSLEGFPGHVIPVQVLYVTSSSTKRSSFAAEERRAPKVQRNWIKRENKSLDSYVLL